MWNELRTLTMADGPSGREDAVRASILSLLPQGVQTKTDALGNLIVFKKGLRRPDQKVVLFAHMDEVGLVITYVCEDGTLKFHALGGVDPDILIGRSVKLESGAYGVIGLKHIHLCNKKEASSVPAIDNLRIDIGARSREEAEKTAVPGDYAVFRSEYTEFGASRIKMKALDDRAGCAILIELLKKELPYDLTCVFTVQEEVGSCGAAAAAVSTDPDIAIVLETTTAGDVCGVTGSERTCAVGAGPVVSYMDRGTVYDHALYRLVTETAEQNHIPCQTKTRIAGGNDAAAIQRAGSGARVAALSVPTRYLHSAVDVMDKTDVESSFRLLEAVLPVLSGESL